ncbi:hypothetical protein [Acinetobacter sp. BSP-28]|uniref:hypothetical protein n=1 Tax=Acinetobacter sp. BSP-28 TaxID=3344661 RepID=UPI00376FEE01
MIEEMLTAQATIQAAEIQKFGTIWGAVIGGAALGIGVFASWLTSLHLQRVARLAETRKFVYLELVENYSDMIMGFQLLLSDLDKNWVNQKKLVMAFSKSIDKTAFICETSTKREILKFFEIFISKFILIQEQINPLIKEKAEVDSLYERHRRAMDLFDDAAMEMEKIKISGEGIEKIPRIQRYFDEKIEEGGGYIKSMNEIAANIKEKSKTISPLLKDLINELSVNSGPIVHLLRKELGAKTDIELDKILQSQMIIE